MKNTEHKHSLPYRVLAALMAVILVAVGLAGCSGGKTESTTKSTQTTESTEATSKDGDNDQTASVGSDTVFSDRDDIAYVMIYNPDIYDENLDRNETVNTGSFEQWIDISAVRADAPSEESPFRFASQANMDKLSDDMKVDLSGSRASIPQPDFKVGDTKDFYYEDSAGKKNGSFNCVFSGGHCCFWVLDGARVADDAYLKSVAEEFDTKVYPADVENFGEPRYADVNGKVHILLHPMENDQLMGYFWIGDLFTHEELTDEEAKEYGANRDLAMIHINIALMRYPEYKEVLCSTLAHELQHLINATDGLEYNGIAYSNTWINESMSGYIEEKLYPGVKDMEGHYESFATSDLIRHGQSMYNFDTTYDDIGVYGSVFLYSQYLENLAGESVFRDFHKYWRTTFDESKLTDDYALYSVVSDAKKQDLDSKYTFPTELTFSSASSEFMSKMTLDFYISLLK